MEYIALGCMSGTSLDGIDCSLVKSDGVSYVTDISAVKSGVLASSFPLTFSLRPYLRLS